MRAIVADDSPVMAAVNARMLGELGHEVVAIVHDGSEAVAKCIELKPDLALLDIAMVPMDGEQAAREIIAQVAPPPRIVFVTNQGRDTTRDRAKTIGAGMVVKPYERVFLEREIGRITGEEMPS